MKKPSLTNPTLFARFPLVLIGLLILMLAACQPQSVEVEVIATVEVEIEAETEIEAEEAFPVETGSGGVGATGSEDADGSPFEPTKGKVNSEQKVAHTIGWIQSSGVITDPTTVRVIASRTEQAVLVMTVNVDGIEQELIVTDQIRRFRQVDLAKPNGFASHIYMEMSPADWDALTSGIDLLLTTNVTEGLACDLCTADDSGEAYAIVLEDQVIRFELDAGESVPEIDRFLDAMRALMQRSAERAQTMWQLTK